MPIAVKQFPGEQCAAIEKNLDMDDASSHIIKYKHSQKKHPSMKKIVRKVQYLQINSTDNSRDKQRTEEHRRNRDVVEIDRSR